MKRLFHLKAKNTANFRIVMSEYLRYMQLGKHPPPLKKERKLYVSL